MLNYAHKQILGQIKFSVEDINQIRKCRGSHNRLGFAYQLVFVRLLNRFPTQLPFELVDSIAMFSSVELNINENHFSQYGNRRPTITEHQDKIRHYLNLKSFSESIGVVKTFLYKEAYQSEQVSALTAKLKAFLKDHNILEPSQDTLNRLIQTQRELARIHVYKLLSDVLTSDNKQQLDDLLLVTNKDIYSPLHYLKQPAGNPSPSSFIKLTQRLESIEKTGILEIDTSNINNNFQRLLARYARQCSISRLKRLRNERRYTVLACFLRQLHQEPYDSAVRMYDKLMSKIYNKADKEINEYMKKQRKNIRKSLVHYKKILEVLSDDKIHNRELRNIIFAMIGIETIEEERGILENILDNKYSDSFKRVISRYSYVRQFSPSLLRHIKFEPDTQNAISKELTSAVSILNKMNREGKHALPKNTPTDFIPKKLKPFLFQGKKLNKAAWESALLTVLREQVKDGNMYVPGGKRYGSLDTFFMSTNKWSIRKKTSFIVRVCHQILMM